MRSLGHMKNWRVILFGLIVLGAAAIVAQRATRPPEVEVKPLTRTDVKTTLSVSGRLESDDESPLGASLSGIRVRSVFVDVGDNVSPGQILLELEKSDLLAAVRQAEARVNSARAQQRTAQVQGSGARRLESVAQRNFRNATELEAAATAARTALRTAEQRVQQAEEALRRAQAPARPEAIEVAEANLRRATALSEQRAREAERARQLHAEGAISDQALETANVALRTAEEDRAAAEANLRQLQTPRTEDVRQAEAQLREAQVTVAGQRRSLELAERALRERTASETAVINAQNQADVAAASLNAAQSLEQEALAALELARANLDKAVIRAPFAGVVTARNVEPGQTVGPNNSNLISVAAPGRLRVRLDIDESNLGQISLGQAALVSPDAFPDLTLPATITLIGSAANFNQGTVEVRLALENQPAQLRPDMTVDATIEVANYPNSIVVPRESVLDPSADPHVYVVENGLITDRKIKIKPGDTINFVVTDGLADTDLIVTKPRGFRPGQRVTTRIVR